MFEKFENISGIYKITFPNNKIYIGLSVNIKQRLNRHNQTDDNLPVHLSIKKYGKISDKNVEILEQLPKDLLSEREKYWINYYKSYLPENGYNLTLGGEGASPGIFNSSAKLNEEQLNNLIQELIENKIFIKDLSKKYGLSPEAISGINQGKRYHNSKLIYPLRKDTRFTSEQCKKTGVEKSSSKFSQEQIDEIINLLKNSDLSFKKISENFNCTSSTISKINSGEHYFNSMLSYPIRKKRKYFSKITKEQLNEIHILLRNTNLSFYKIAEKFNVSDSTIGRINSENTIMIKIMSIP